MQNYIWFSQWEQLGDGIPFYCGKPKLGLQDYFGLLCLCVIEELALIAACRSLSGQGPSRWRWMMRLIILIQDLNKRPEAMQACVWFELSGSLSV